MKRNIRTGILLLALSGATLLPGMANATMESTSDLVNAIRQQHAQQPNMQPPLFTGRGATTAPPPRMQESGAPISPHERETNTLQGVDPYAE